jgi:hypothetical protein
VVDEHGVSVCCARMDGALCARAMTRSSIPLLVVPWMRSGDLSHKIKKIRKNLGAIGFHCQSGLREVAHGNSSHQGSS